ncbi:MAG: squalene/phytoene synthase family protein [Hyphomonadaceae bacterium]
MSDTANPPKLASAAEFDARLKRADEDRWLASRYAPAVDRERIAAIYLLNQELQRTLQTSEPMLGKIRLQWWRETMEQVAGNGPVRRHDLAEELARVLAGRADLHAAAAGLIDCYDDILDDHLHAGGHQPGGDHEARHLAVEGAVMKLAGIALDATVAPEHLATLAALGEARIALSADLPHAAARWHSACQAARKLPAALWPAILHLALVDLPSPQASDFARRWRLLKTAFTHRL